MQKFAMQQNSSAPFGGVCKRVQPDTTKTKQNNLNDTHTPRIIIKIHETAPDPDTIICLG